MVKYRGILREGVCDKWIEISAIYHDIHEDKVGNRYCLDICTYISLVDGIRLNKPITVDDNRCNKYISSV